MSNNINYIPVSIKKKPICSIIYVSSNTGYFWQQVKTDQVSSIIIKTTSNQILFQNYFYQVVSKLCCLRAKIFEKSRCGTFRHFTFKFSMLFLLHTFLYFFLKSLLLDLFPAEGTKKLKDLFRFKLCQSCFSTFSIKLQIFYRNVYLILKRYQVIENTFQELFDFALFFSIRLKFRSH